jgi:tungstate transport system ATP-binding protein
MTPLVEVSDLLVQRGGRMALEVDELQVERGDVLALVGPNGAGKSTLLLALARLIPVTRGKLGFAGRSVADWDALEYRRKMSFVFQDPLLLDLTVAQNVAVGLRFRGLGRDEIEVRVLRWLKLLGIEGLGGRRASQLSGGEAQRVSLARALVLDPELLLLDEPFAALDPPARARLLDDLSGLLAEDHRATIFVTHDLKEAAQLAHRIGVMVGGRLRQVGTARQIKAHPADDQVAAFLKTL